MRAVRSQAQPDMIHVVMRDEEAALLREALRKPRGASQRACAVAKDLRAMLKRVGATA